MHMYGNVTSATLIKTGHEFHQFHSRFVHVISYLDDTESIKSIQFTELPESYQYFKYYYINSATLKLDIYSTYFYYVTCPPKNPFTRLPKIKVSKKHRFKKSKTPTTRVKKSKHQNKNKIKTPATWKQLL